MSKPASPHPPSKLSLPDDIRTGDYARALVNILEDTGDERDRLETANKAVLNILEDADAEKHRLREMQRAVLNILEDADAERQRLREMQRAVLNILEDLDVEKRRAENASRMKSEFLANMSHELRTPLNSIIGFAQLMVEGKVGPLASNHQEYIGDILSSGRHLLQLINDVLDLSKVEAGKMEFSSEVVDLENVVNEVHQTLRGLAASRSIRIEHRVSPELRDVVADTARLKQVLFNFLSNAIKFTDEGGLVRVVAEPEDAKTFRLSVTDTGQGIAPDDQARLFVEFEQLDASMRKRHQGTGLGLALTRRLVEAQGGWVGLTSEVGVGSTFFAVLPKATGEGTSDAHTHRVREVRVVEGTTRVMVVEDDPSQREWLIRALAQAGFDAVGVGTGVAAIDLARSTTFDAITLDLVLPDMVGADVLRAIRGGIRNAHTPVVAVTGHPDRALAAFSVVEILTKPVDQEMLLEALQRVGVHAGGEACVCIVDDDASHRRLLGQHLKAEGYRVMAYPGGAEALAGLQRDRPQALILDLLMPSMSGIEFLSRIKRDPVLRKIPVIVWTSQQLSRAEQEHLLDGAVSLLEKSDGAEALLSEIRRIVPLRSESTP